MSNEVTKEAEEKVETPNPATKQENAETPATTKAENEPKTTKLAPPAETAAPAPETVVPKPAEAAAPASAPAEEKKDASDADEMDFGAILEQFEQEQVTYHAGELVKGKVVGLSDQGALVDFGYKSEGTVATEEITNEDGEPKISVGEDIEVVIKSMGTGENPPSLSLFDAKRRRSWNEIEKSFNDNEIVKGTVRSKTKGGLKVDVNGVEAFLPGSQIDSRPVRNLDALIGEEIETRVIKFSRKRNNIVLSRKVITDEAVNKEKAETLSKVHEGYIVEGIVKNLTDYGAFVDIGGIDGLLHVTDMSWGRLHNPGDLFKVADTVQVKILKLDRQKEKVSLGYKQLLPDPWATVTELYPVDARIKGKVSSVTEYGAFVELEPGVEGLVHVTEMSWSKRLKHPKHLVKKGDEVEVQVLGIDPDERRISLGIKQLQANPWDTIADRYQVGSQIKGNVRNLTDFGAFVEVEDGVDGLVHVSDISWSKKIKHPKDVLKKGQEVEAVVTNIDIGGRRLSLSIKELTPSSWEQYTNEHKPGDVVKGKISRFASFGIFVELAPDLEGLCHISELSDERIENAEDLFEVDQELDFKILRIEHDVEKIGLSHRSVGREDDESVDSKSYSSQAKSGMASLGELAKLKIGSEDAEETEDSAGSDKVSDEPKAESTPLEAKSDGKAEEPKEKKADEKKAEEPKEEKADEKKAEEPPKADSDEKTEAKSDKKPEDKDEKASDSDGKDAKAEESKEESKKANDEKAEKAEEKSDAKEETKKEAENDPAAEADVKSEDAPADEDSKAKSEEEANTPDSEAKKNAEEEKAEDSDKKDSKSKKKGSKS